MSDKDNHPNKIGELRSICKYHIDLYNSLYQLKTEKDEDLNSIYKMIKTEMIDSKKCLPKNIIRDILKVIPYNNRYTKSYLKLAKLISDDYRVKEVSRVKLIPTISNYLYYKEYGIKLDKSDNFEEIKSENLDIHTENTIYRAIMYDDRDRFITFIERDDFDEGRKLKSSLYPNYYKGNSLLELCCYHGAIDCFKLLRTKFDSEITDKCLELSFLGGNPEIMSECLKYQKLNDKCMEYAIASHNIDFVTFLMNEYNKRINLYDSVEYNNLESLLVYFDQTNDINKCFIFSAMFDIPSFCEYLLSHGANINEKFNCKETALHIAAKFNCKETAKLLISYGANINEKNLLGYTSLFTSALNNCKETAELLISQGANINEIDKNGNTALHAAALNRFKEIAELLISHGVKINEKNNDGRTPLHITTKYISKEMAEILIPHDTKFINDDHIIISNRKYKEIVEGSILEMVAKNVNTTFLNAALHPSLIEDCKEITKLLISHGANINEKDIFGNTALHNAVHENYKEITKLLISHGANINERDIFGRTALHYAASYNSKEIVEILIKHGANINEKDISENTALYYAGIHFHIEIEEILISHGGNPALGCAVY
ncbi:ankyrin repeat protein, putative [Trichomonas vaginalis G3]|uniref:Ankyrin repeat protein, putative n=1 Tax=Trichomonas vaginalis (strain ATCC PRA-98 / G3) TaxID=412133 RepID=A2F3Z4_TRIV3|nr:ankyrin repeat and SOCS box-containing protein 4 family [Trichomonas vaginalis G3]EAY00348.1 ankyrin repeat protein, putative [Trichomonas vaginalis G3]KAI5552330.1 ankyrin repeat and SOCS box-containing protein 4 family [Trichomonas vaginalis G3]|eukprot:XP_001313277.1 ankyrin repeat protein [Trichomonas vaginalis G3]